MEQDLYGPFRLSALDRRGDERRRAVRSRNTTSMALVTPFTQLEQRRAHPTSIAPLTVIRQLVAAIRLWRRRARSRQKLHELSDHVLKDIGLRREHLLSEFSKPIRRLD